MTFWLDPEVKKDAKELAASMIEMHDWKGHVPMTAEKTVSELIRAWNTAMAANVVLDKLIGHISPDGLRAADAYAKVITTFYQHINPAMRDKRNITMEVCVVGALLHLHERHAFMLNLSA